MDKKESKILKGYQGIFFDEETQKKLVQLQEDGLDDVVNDMHITFNFGELYKFPDELMNKEIVLKLIGYASDGKNSGFQVEIPEELDSYYKNKNGAHITVSLGEVDGVKGKAVDTGTMNFEEIDPVEISGKLGYFVFRKDRTKSGKVMDNSLFEENIKETTKDLTDEELYEEIKLNPHIMKQLDAPSLKAAMEGYVELKDAKNILKYANIESISNPEIIDLISYEVGGELWDFCYGGHGFIEGDDEVLGLNKKGIQIISNKIVDIASERDSNEQSQTISVMLDIWKKFMEPYDDEINDVKAFVNEIITKRNEEKYKKDDFKSVDVRYGEIQEVLDETIVEQDRINNPEQEKKGQTQGDN